MNVIPAVDVLDGRVVRLMRGAYDQVTVFDEDPVGRARMWVDQGADLIHLVDLEGARTGRPDLSLWSSMAAAGVPFQVGGGIRSADDARAAIEAGAMRVVMGSAAVWNPSALEEVGDVERVVAAVDVRDGRATGAGWLDEGRELDAVLDDLSRVGVGRILSTGIATDGTMAGPELDLMRHLIRDERFSIIASGGVGDLDDLRTLSQLDCEAVVVGRALYENRFTVAEAIVAAGAA